MTTTYAPGQACAATISGAFYVIPAAPITGQNLLNHVANAADKFPAKSDLVASAGYLRPNGKLSFVGFYENLLEAKLNKDPDYFIKLDKQQEQDEQAQYDALSQDGQALYDYVHQHYGEKWNHDDIMSFLDNLSDLGIDTVKVFEDAFYSHLANSWDWQERFAEDFCHEIYSIDSEAIYVSAIDWQRVWDHSLDYDFSYFEWDDEIFLFRRDY